MSEYFKAFSALAGVDDLTASLKINAVTETPAFRYKGDNDANGEGPPGIIWTARNSAADLAWRGVTYGEPGGSPLFVACAVSGVGNRIQTSPDGINWTIRTSAADHQWQAICYGEPGGSPLFVAVADSSVGERVQTSPDGINWTIRTSAADLIWEDVCYGEPGGSPLFVAVARDGVANSIMTSPDGINWTIRTSAALNQWRGVTWGNGLFVAVASSGAGNRVQTSPDGINWTSRAESISNNWWEITYGEPGGSPLFVAVAASGLATQRSMYSSDGINWTTGTTVSNARNWYDVTWGDDLFVAVSSSGQPDDVMTSEDGINWKARTSATSNGYPGVCYGAPNGIPTFCAISWAGVGNRVMTSGPNDSGWEPWSYGESLALQPGTAPTYNDGSPCFGSSNDDSVKLNGGGYWEHPSDSYVDITTEDLVIEGIFRTPDSIPANELIFSKAGTPYDATIGQFIVFQTNKKLAWGLQDSSSAGGTETTALGLSTWYHFLMVADRDGYAQFYINGVASGTPQDITGEVDSLSNTDPFIIGADSAGATNANINLAYLALWARDEWLDSYDQAAIAAERFGKLCGMYPEVFSDTIVPNIATRASGAYLEKYNSSTSKIDLYYVGENWLRFERWIDLNDNLIDGFHREEEIQNLIVESEDFATTWAKVDAGDTVDTDAEDAPDDRAVADGLIADNTDGNHGVSIAPTLTADIYTFSVFGKKGDQDWIKLEDTTIANVSAYFDLDTGATGTTGSACSARIDGPYKNDFYRCSITFTGTVAAHTLRVLSAPDDNDDTFAGDSIATNSYLWGAQCEKYDTATSQIITDGGTATREQDRLQFKTGGNIGGEAVQEGLIQGEFLLRSHDTATGKALISLNDGSATDRVFVQIATNDQFELKSLATGGDPGVASPAGDISDGYNHKFYCQWKTDSLIAVIDGTETDEDTACDMPVYLSQMEIGGLYDGSLPFSGLISSLSFQSIVQNDGFRDEGDVLLFHTLDNGDITYTGGLIEMCGGLETMAYLCLFGGNDDDDGTPGNPKTWWGNVGELDPAKQYRSRTQYVLDRIPATSANLPRVEDAVREDLDVFITEKIATEINITVGIPAPNRIEILAQIYAGDEPIVLRWIENWRAL